MNDRFAESVTYLTMKVIKITAIVQETPKETQFILHVRAQCHTLCFVAPLAHL